MTVRWDLKKTSQRVSDAVERGLKNVAEHVRQDAVRRIEEPPKTGRIYAGPPFRVGRPQHQASKPGESPADDTGALKRSGKVRMAGKLKAEVSFNAGYARNLEMGIPTGPYPLEARPFMRPATLAAEKEAKKIIEKELFG